MSEPTFFPPPPPGMASPSPPPPPPPPVRPQQLEPPPPYAPPRKDQGGWQVIGVLLIVFGGGAYVLESPNAAVCSSALTAGADVCTRDNLIHSAGLVGLIIGCVLVLYAAIASR